jgi:nicotinamidase-related amidase
VTIVEDACSASTPAAHVDAVERMTDGSFIAARTTSDLVAEVGALTGAAAA